MTKRDEEFYILKITDAVIAGLNAKITAINTEKDDSVVLPEIKEDAFEFFGSAESIGNFDPFLLFHITNDFIDNAKGSSVENLIIQCELWISNQLLPSGRDLLIMLSRYRRAIREILKDQSGGIQGFSLVNLTTEKFTSKDMDIEAYGTGVAVQIGNAYC